MKDGELLVFCGICNEGYVGWDATQAHGCAANIARTDHAIANGQVAAGQWYAKGHYGSRFDTTIFRMVVDDPKKIDPVCDACMARLIETGALSAVEGHYL